ncbi:MAG: hypothetical protein CSYNP_03102 [Syntrophus sp. SKADARSKE-3]|nr:hypothetical protein [Syntrophus sp. SKADARSKE-3]
MINKIYKIPKIFFNGLLNTGYTTKDNFNYTKPLNKYYRFHAHIVGDYIEIHIDGLNNGYYKIVKRPYVLEKEILNIKENNHTIKP